MVTVDYQQQGVTSESALSWTAFPPWELDFQSEIKTCPRVAAVQNHQDSKVISRTPAPWEYIVSPKSYCTMKCHSTLATRGITFPWQKKREGVAHWQEMEERRGVHGNVHMNTCWCIHVSVWRIQSRSCTEISNINCESLLTIFPPHCYAFPCIFSSHSPSFLSSCVSVVMIISRSWFGYVYELCTHAHTRTAYLCLGSWARLADWDRQLVAVLLKKGEEESPSVVLSLFWLSTSVSTISLLPVFATQSNNWTSRFWFEKSRLWNLYDIRAISHTRHKAAHCTNFTGSFKPRQSVFLHPVPMLCEYFSMLILKQAL